MRSPPGLPPDRARSMFHEEHPRVASYDGEPALLDDAPDGVWVLRWGVSLREARARVTWIWTRAS